MTESRPFKARPIELDRDADVASLARVAVASCCEQIRQNTPGAQKAEDPGFAHQLRVGTRRLRVALRLFKGAVDREQRVKLENTLRQTFHTLGAQRELDVLLSDLIAPMRSEAPSAALDALREKMEQERERRREAVRELLASKDHARLLGALDELERVLAEQDQPRQSARKWARRKLERRRDAALALTEAALSGPAERRHDLRKALKKLRYASEMASGLFKHKRVKAYLSALSEVQDVLGALNDAHAGREELARMDADPELLLTCEAQLARRESAELEKLAPALAALTAARPFWRKG